MTKLYKNKFYDIYIHGEDYGTYITGTVILSNHTFYEVGYQTGGWIPSCFEKVNIENLPTKIKLEIFKNI